jgi:hypothetical protein
VTTALPVVSAGDGTNVEKDGVADPYTQIYNKTAQQVWWGMVDETLIDPANLAEKNGTTAVEMYSNAITTAMRFHDALKLYCHPVTYAYFGSDDKQIAFSNVSWVTRAVVPSEAAGNIPTLTSTSSTKLGSTTLTIGSQTVTFSLANRDKPESDSDPSSGDGTVPGPSGALISEGSGKMTVFRMKGFDHQHSYGDHVVQGNVLYCISKIVQGAQMVEELPDCKE